MTAEEPSTQRNVALIDTSVQVDRKKTGRRAGYVEGILSGFPITLTTSIGLLEFKATLIQECITIHDNLRLKRRFTATRDALLEKQYRQVSLRAHIFNNLLDVFGNSFGMSDQEDARLAEKARLKLEQIIPRLYDWFVSESADAVLRGDILCNRAAERPTKGDRVSFGTNLPRCVRGKNKTCLIERFIRTNAEPLLTELRKIVASAPPEEGGQLTAAIALFEAVLSRPDLELTHRDCRSAGDCLIALEGASHATHALSTNAREWRPLCQILGYEFIHVQYRDEKTR